MNKKYFVITDIHGFYDEMMSALNEAGFDINNPEHIIINLGDSCDRGGKPKEVLEFLMNLYKQGRAILIRGNHETLMVEAIWRGNFQSHDKHNGTEETAKILTGEKFSLAACFAMKDCKLFWDYYDATIDFYETDNAVFVHGWIPYKMEMSTDEKYKSLPELYRPCVATYDENWREGNWEDARWQNGMMMWSKNIRVPGKTVYCGHFHANFGRAYIDKTHPEWPEEDKIAEFDWSPYVNEQIVALDGCTAYSGKVNVVVIDGD